MKRTIVTSVVGITAAVVPAALIIEKTSNARDQTVVLATATKENQHSSQLVERAADERRMQPGRAI
jgi:hypothetical protein